MGIVIPPSMKVIIRMMTSLSSLRVTIWSGAQYPLRNVVFSPKTLHIGFRIYKMFEPTHLGELKRRERSFQGKETKDKRAENKTT